MSSVPSNSMTPHAADRRMAVLRDLAVLLGVSPIFAAINHRNCTKPWEESGVIRRNPMDSTVLAEPCGKITPLVESFCPSHL